MLKNKPLNIFILDKNYSKDEINSLALTGDETVVVFGMQGIGESLQTERLVDEKNRDRIFFVHMSEWAFEKVSAETIEEKADFTMFHFYYDLFKVPKFKFNTKEYTHFCWTVGIDFEASKKITKLVELNPDTEIIILDSDNPILGGSVKISEFEKSMSSSFFSKEKDSEVQNAN